MSQQPVVDVCWHTRVVHGELPERRLHPVKAGGFPDVVDDEVGGACGRGSLVAFQFYANLFTEVVRNLDNVSYAGPWLLEITQISKQNIKKQNRQDLSEWRISYSLASEDDIL